MATIEEVDAAVAAAGAAPGVCLLHCVTAYPAPPAASNLRAIPALADRFGVPVGWSDHTRDATTALGALALGACLFEKHLTVDRSLPGPDHVASSTPDELAAYVNAIRELAGALGDGAKRPMEIERENRIYARRSVHAARDLTEGDELQPQDVVLLRPATGLAPDVAITGKRLRRAVGAGDPITADDLA
jgi:N-acetylneuraminate synthase/N,N'-diacetyllegionaminate synthase